MNEVVAPQVSIHPSHARAVGMMAPLRLSLIAVLLILLTLSTEVVKGVETKRLLALPSHRLSEAEHRFHARHIHEKGIAPHERDSRAHDYIQQMAAGVTEQDLADYTPLSFGDHSRFWKDVQNPHHTEEEHHKAFSRYSEHVSMDYAAFVQLGTHSRSTTSTAVGQIALLVSIAQVVLALLQGVIDWLFGEAVFFNVKLCWTQVRDVLQNGKAARTLHTEYEELVRMVLGGNAGGPLTPEAIFDQFTLEEDFYVYEASHATPLWFRFDGTSKTGENVDNWFWTPDKTHWMPAGVDVVSGGRWEGQRPVKENLALLEWLHKVNPFPNDLTLAECTKLLGTPENGLFRVKDGDAGVFTSYYITFRLRKNNWEWNRGGPWHQVTESFDSKTGALLDELAEDRPQLFANRMLLAFLANESPTIDQIEVTRALILLGSPKRSQLGDLTRNVYEYDDVFFRYKGKEATWEWSWANPEKNLWIDINTNFVPEDKEGGWSLFDAALDTEQQWIRDKLARFHPLPLKESTLGRLRPHRSWWNPLRWLDTFSAIKDQIIRVAKAVPGPVEEFYDSLKACISDVQHKCFGLPKGSSSDDGGDVFNEEVTGNEAPDTEEKEMTLATFAFENIPDEADVPDDGLPPDALPSAVADGEPVSGHDAHLPEDESVAMSGTSLLQESLPDTEDEMMEEEFDLDGFDFSTLDLDNVEVTDNPTDRPPMPSGLGLASLLDVKPADFSADTKALCNQLKQETEVEMFVAGISTGLHGTGILLSSGRVRSVVATSARAVGRAVTAPVRMVLPEAARAKAKDSVLKLLRGGRAISGKVLRFLYKQVLLRVMKKAIVRKLVRVLLTLLGKAAAFVTKLATPFFLGVAMTLGELALNVWLSWDEITENMEKIQLLKTQPDRSEDDDFEITRLWGKTACMLFF